MTFPILPPAVAEQAIDLADQLRTQVGSAPPPAVAGLSPHRRAAYDRLLDAVNRLPRPLMVLGSLALVGSALVAPEWFTARMDALSDMPEGLWWLIGAILSLHFGARYQDRSHEFRREVAATAPKMPSAGALLGTDADLVLRTLDAGPNPALDAWRSAKA